MSRYGKARQAPTVAVSVLLVVVHQVRQTVTHEVTHHFGIDDRRLCELAGNTPGPPTHLRSGQSTRTAVILSPPRGSLM